MYEVDFLPVESPDGPGSRSGDAIAIRWREAGESNDTVVVIDSGFTAIGDSVADHVTKYYGTGHIDAVISTHPDADHINGIARVLERLSVGELLLHQPRLHHDRPARFSNIEAIDNLLQVAADFGVTVSEPFAGLSRFGERLLVLGPTEAYYEELIAEHIFEEESAAGAKRVGIRERVGAQAANLLDYVLDSFPVETLTDGGETGPRNNSSVITLLRLDDRPLLLTGDAGVPALEAAAALYEREVGSFRQSPLRFFQAPHHGSKRNLGPTILDRMLGPPGAPHGDATTAFISSAAAAKKHPSPKVVNALSRRGCLVNATEGMPIRHGQDAPPRDGWTNLTPLPPLREDTDDE